MFDFLKSTAEEGPTISAQLALARLVGALVLGWLVALVYRRTRPNSKAGAPFQATLVLLSVLIAIVTQVVGGNTARAFSLVGALSIVRFRTVVQDTQDTAFVIFAVVMGMAAGAGTVWVAVIGLVIVTLAAFLMRSRETATTAGPQPAFVLNLRIGLGHDVETLLNGTLDAHLSARRLVTMETVRQGTAIDVTYEVEFRPDGSAEGLLKALNRLDGVQNVHLQDSELDDD